jgi:DNA primase
MKNVSQVVTSFEMPEYITPRKHQIVDWCNKWGLDVDALELQYDVKENRVVFPIKDNGRIVDATGRSILNRLPKWKRYGSSDLPFSFGCGSIAIVVEDCISAGVIGSDVYVGVAVLGTSLLDSHKTFLSQFSTAIIALDPDALPKSFAFAKELRSHVKTVKILKLKDDLKYRKKEDLNNLKLLTPKETQLWN